jgi:hypothetical protein
MRTPHSIHVVMPRKVVRRKLPDQTGGAGQGITCLGDYDGKKDHYFRLR